MTNPVPHPISRKDFSAGEYLRKRPKNNPIPGAKPKIPRLQFRQFFKVVSFESNIHIFSGVLYSFAKNEIFKNDKEKPGDDQYRHGLNPLMGITQAVDKGKKDQEIEQISE